MFTGFASENTPAIQVWDFSNTFASSSAIRSVSLADDCAPIQYFKTGGSTTNIRVYLPTSPIEGKVIKVVVARYGNSNQNINIYAPDGNYINIGTGNPLTTIGNGQTIDLCYSKYFLTAFSNTPMSSGWIFLNQSPVGSATYYSAILGGDNNLLSSSYSGMLGGVNNISTGQYSAVIAGSNSTASGSSAAVVGGSSNTASNQNAVVIGGGTNTAGGDSSVIVGGLLNTANGQSSVVVGGQSNTAGGGGTNSVVVGGAWGTTRNISGNFVTPASAIPITATTGVNQLATLLIARQTTDATATRLTSNTSAAGTTNQVILPNNSAYYVKGSIIATVTGGGNTKSWDFIATIKRGANAAATSIVGAVTLNVQAADAGASTWVVAITADTTNGGLAVTVTGQAATTIRWVAKLESTEVTY